MKKKEEIYVVVDTPKKAKKLQKVLDMFGERIERFTRESIEEYNAPWLEEKTPSVFYDSENKWIGEHAESLEGKQKVSIKELRNILAVSHLKEGDVVVCEDNGDTAIGIYKEHDEFGFDLHTTKYFDIDYVCDGGCFDNFIRYATEEEKALLEPKEENKELVFGKWYTCDDMKNVMVFYESYGKYYGINNDGLWVNVNTFDLNSEDPYNYREATTEEVKQALVKEAEKRYNVGDKVSKIYDDYSEGLRVFNNNFHYQESNNTLWMKDVAKEGYPQDSCIFKDGKWAEVLPQPETHTEITDKDIATLERLHDTLHDVHGYSLEFELMKSARVLSEKLRELNTQNK